MRIVVRWGKQRGKGDSTDGCGEAREFCSSMLKEDGWSVSGGGGSTYFFLLGSRIDLRDDDVRG
jgi:hypothetical protein